MGYGFFDKKGRIFVAEVVLDLAIFDVLFWILKS